ncbi:hypothetical protein AYI98_07605 [Shewanella algae]|uniref:6-carboxytetrahydropterin synthase n=1 Tax=Shewanella algae TaxID=38313 RepID=UPI0011844F38|nr:6-carboxytetrahydropterin synthase [Shewanella algae]TVL50787.1 hypothetical protein AYI98_07605 [Shewanella algae]
MKLFVNDLTVIDSSVVYADRGIVGESWIVDLMLIGDLNSESMVLDFGVVKKQIKALIDQLVDHCLIVPTKASSVTYVKDAHSTWVMGNRCREATFFVKGPAQAFCFIDSDFIDEATLSTYLEGAILSQLPENVKNISLTLRREWIDEPYYHYSHGLKKHSGNCQRIAHGHRSRIKVFKNGKIDRELQEYWAKRWEDIYLVTEEDIVDAATLSVPALELQGERFIASSYESGQGMFEILLPLERVEVVNIDSTVEEIASYIARELAEQNQGQMIEVHAFEGVGKGAIAEELIGGGL